MPCDSTVTETKMTDAARIEAALKAEGWQRIVVRADEIVATAAGRQPLSFYRYGSAKEFSTTSTDVASVQAVQRKYAEIGMRDWAKRRGYTISREGEKFVLRNRSK